MTSARRARGGGPDVGSVSSAQPQAAGRRSKGAGMSPESDRVVATARATLLATSRLETEIRAGEFVGLADDPGAGAPGAGPTPTEYLMMALASCTAITL